MSVPETTVLPSAESRRKFPAIVGESSALRRALAKLDLAIDSQLPALIVGETGVGKELFARALHEHGPRAGRAFVALNCGAVPESLFEAELFGHARGSFTSADRARPGLIAEAEGGTLLLDEIAELPLSRQAVLLRVLESRRYRPVGSDQERPFDVRIVAATNRDLEAEVRAKTFRQDLLFRINALEIRVPPLRDRAADVPLLARTFLARAGASSTIAKDALAAIAAYSWPGNARELEHHMQRIAALRLPRVELEHLPRALRGSSGGARALAVDAKPVRMREASDERAEIVTALEETGGNISRAALRLGITRHGLKKRMVRLGMRASAGAEEGSR